MLLFFNRFSQVPFGGGSDQSRCRDLGRGICILLVAMSDHVLSLNVWPDRSIKRTSLDQWIFIATGGPVLCLYMIDCSIKRTGLDLRPLTNPGGSGRERVVFLYTLCVHVVELLERNPRRRRCFDSPTEVVQRTASLIVSDPRANCASHCSSKHYVIYEGKLSTCFRDFT